MDIAHQLQKIGVLFADDRFISVLKKMASSLMPPIVIERITREKTAHKLRNPLGTAEKKEMNVIGH